MSSKVLIVDDELAARELCRDFLEVDGYDLEVVDGARPALERLAQVPFDLVLTDLSMPVMDGLSLLKEVKRAHPTVEVIMMTAYGSIASSVEAMKSGAFDYITKPFSREILSATVGRCLQTQGLKAQLARAREELVKKEKLAAIGAMAAGIAHRMRNPLGIIMMCAQYLEGKLVASEEHRQILVAIEEKVRTLEKLTRDFIEYSRASQAKRIEAHIGRLIEDVLENVKTRCRIQGVELVREVPEGLPAVKLDTDLVREALANIVDNALEAMNGAGRVTVRASGLSEGGVEVAIENTGSCPEPGLLEKIFEPFFTTKEMGIGLGLAIVRQVVEAHGGSARAAGNPEARTTTFSLRFPSG